MAHGTVQRDDVIDRRSRCYGIMIEADGNTGNGTSFHNDISAVIAAFMAIAGHYSKPVHAVRWRFQAERDRRTDGLCYRAFIDFGYAVKMRTALHWCLSALIWSLYAMTMTSNARRAIASGMTCDAAMTMRVWT